MAAAACWRKYATASPPLPPPRSWPRSASRRLRAAANRGTARATRTIGALSAAKGFLRDWGGDFRRDAAPAVCSATTATRDSVRCRPRLREDDRCGILLASFVPSRASMTLERPPAHPFDLRRLVGDWRGIHLA